MKFSINPFKIITEEFSQYEVVQLFLDRARLVDPHFSLQETNAPFIAQICYRLDGIPLAIELATARIKMMAVEQVSARLDDRFRLPTGGARTGKRESIYQNCGMIVYRNV